MLAALKSLLQSYFQALTEDSSRQLAAGLALGIWLGLIPKTSLFAGLLTVIVLATPVNATLAIGVAFFASWLGLLLDPLTSSLGSALLHADVLRPLWTWLFSLPVVPWTQFHHSVVLGNFLLGLVVAYPLYRFSEPCLRRWSPRLAELPQRVSWLRWLAPPDETSAADESSAAADAPAT